MEGCLALVAYDLSIELAKLVESNPLAIPVLVCSLVAFDGFLHLVSVPGLGIGCRGFEV
jgi:hypothetical protein